MAQDNYTLNIAMAEAVDNGSGKNDIVISMVSLYKNGKFVRHCKLDEDLLQGMQRLGTIGFDLKRLR